MTEDNIAQICEADIARYWGDAVLGATVAVWYINYILYNIVYHKLHAR